MTVLRSICFLQPLLTLGCLCTVFWPLSLLSRSPTWGKAKPLLGHNLWATCTTSPVLLLPLWTYTYLSLLPECLLPASWPDQVCSCSRALAHRGLLAWKALAPVVVWCLILRYLQVSQGTDFPQLLSPIIKAICPLLPWQPSVCSPASSSPRAPLPVGSLALTPSWVMKGCRRARAVLCAAAPQDWGGPTIR